MFFEEGIMFAIILSAILLIYGLLVFYIGRSGWTYIRPYHTKWLKWIYIAIVLLLSTSFILGRFGEGIVFLQIVGSYWMMIFSLLLLILPIIHISMWILRLTKLPRHQVDRGAGVVILIVLITCITLGSFNAYNPVVRTYEIEIQNQALAGEKLNIVMAADMHFGMLSGVNHAHRLVAEINALQPDLVLFPGDIIDDDIHLYLNKGFDVILDGIESKYGVYASLGNHDRYRGTMEELITALEGNNITVLYDESITINNQFTLVGRKDKSDRNRSELSDVMYGIDRTKPLFLLEHQPVELGIAAEQGIDLMVSGHTHRGQVFPANFITSRIFENDYGYLLKGNMHSIVTSGYGFWGPPIRLGSRSEIVQIVVSFVD